MGNVIRKKTTRFKKLGLYALLPTVAIFLSGCMRLDAQGNPKGWMSHLIYNYLVLPLNSLLHYLAGNLGSYALALIVLTILFRLIITPLSLNQQRSMIENQVKMQRVKPLTDKIQERLKQTNDPQEQQAIQLEMAKVYKQYGIGIGNQLMGCLPLFIQMPIFVAILHVVNNSKEIASSTFLGIELGQRSFILAILVGAVYYLQSKIMTVGTEDANQQASKSMALTTPIMFLFISLTGPAGVALYWLVGGIIGVIQQFLINKYYKPKIKAEVEAEYKDMPVELPDRLKQMETATQEKSTSTFEQKQRSRNRRRNENVQQRRRKK